MVVCAVTQIWKRVDANGDGSVSCDELCHELRGDDQLCDALGLGKTKAYNNDCKPTVQRLEEVRAVFMDMDQDGSGEVSWEEFRDYIQMAARKHQTTTPLTQKMAFAPLRDYTEEELCESFAIFGAQPPPHQFTLSTFTAGVCECFTAMIVW